MKNINCDKMIIAILNGGEYHEAIQELNEQGFYATVLHSSGGFLKKPSATIMIRLNHEHLDEALQLLKHHGERMEVRYQPASLGMPVSHASAVSIPLQIRCGGVVLFVFDIEQYERY